MADLFWMSTRELMEYVLISGITDCQWEQQAIPKKVSMRIHSNRGLIGKPITVVHCLLVISSLKSSAFQQVSPFSAMVIHGIETREYRMAECFLSYMLVMNILFSKSFYRGSNTKRKNTEFL